MRAIIVTLFSVGLFSCNSGNKVKPATSTIAPENHVTPDFNVALNFINDYTKFLYKDRSAINRNRVGQTEFIIN